MDDINNLDDLKKVASNDVIMKCFTEFLWKYMESIIVMIKILYAIIKLKRKYNDCRIYK